MNVTIWKRPQHVVGKRRDDVRGDLRRELIIDDVAKRVVADKIGRRAKEHRLAIVGDFRGAATRGKAQCGDPSWPGIVAPAVVGQYVERLQVLVSVNRKCVL